MTSTTQSAATTTVPSSSLGSAQSSQGITITAFITALTVALIFFGVQIFIFFLLKNQLARIYKPKTYLVTERERIAPPPNNILGWFKALFKFKDREVIKKCGLDAYFFLRYLQTLLIIFIPLAMVVLPILVSINAIGGRGDTYALEFGNSSDSNNANVTGLDKLAWGNIRPASTHRYWAHLILALVVIVWVCAIFFTELKVYIKVRQDYLTSAEHRLRASATTVLVTAIPQKWLTIEALRGLYDVFPGGIRNIWINRNYDVLLEKIHSRDKVALLLEAGMTTLVRKAKKAREKQLRNLASTQKKKSKEEKIKQQKIDDQNAERLAQEGGTSAGDDNQVPHTLDDAIDEAVERARVQDRETEQIHNKEHGFKIPIIGGGLAAVGQGFDAVGQGFGKGFDAAGKAGGTILGGARNAGKAINNQVEMSNGFVALDSSPVLEDDDYDQFGRYRKKNPSTDWDIHQFGLDGAGQQRDNEVETPSPTSTNAPNLPRNETELPGNTVTGATNDSGGDTTSETGLNWWKFWQPPAGGFASPKPAGYEEGDEFPIAQSDGTRQPSDAEEKKKGFFKKISAFIPFYGVDELAPLDYPQAFNPGFRDDAHEPVWTKYLKPGDRPTIRLPRYTWVPNFAGRLPFLGKKVDLIEWCRERLAQLNVEISMDQASPERVPLMNSAFVQFNHQVAAHMACQAVTHHIPKHMAPRTVEISPGDVIWENMSIKWWESWLRTGITTICVAGMIILWLVPVGWTASVGQLSALADRYTWLKWLHALGPAVLSGLSGIIPPLLLSILLLVVPWLMKILAHMQGAKTGTEVERTVQMFYFGFLFVQVFLVVSISGGALATLTSASTVTAIPDTLATQLPKASNYFFNYMIVQSLSTCAGTLLQPMVLLAWFVVPKLWDSTARQKWARNTTLPTVTWGTFFPVYTNFACIALIYSVVAPIIIIFAIITFGLLWVANRYNMLYVTQFKNDTGGLLYPRAINQTFTGLYFMELCLVGLFILVRDEDGNASCIPQAIIMVVAFALTALYQFLLNWSFGPLLHYLPITFEDEAVLRDAAFERMQAQRLGLVGPQMPLEPEYRGAIELKTMGPRAGRRFARFNPVNAVKEAGSWAARSGRAIVEQTPLRKPYDPDEKPPIRKRIRDEDLEAQKKISDALYGDYCDDIEDLSPRERDILVRNAFQHVALQSRRPTIWIPRDDTGVSDDEIKRIREYAGGNIWISNVGAALDSKGRAVYGRNPPDFSEVSLIHL